jgi:hypothetical protein
VKNPIRSAENRRFEGPRKAAKQKMKSRSPYFYEVFCGNEGLSEGIQKKLEKALADSEHSP